MFSNVVSTLEVTPAALQDLKYFQQTTS